MTYIMASGRKFKRMKELIAWCEKNAEERFQQYDFYMAHVPIPTKVTVDMGYYHKNKRIYKNSTVYAYTKVS